MEFAFKLRFSWKLYPLIKGFPALVKKTLFGCYHLKSNKWNPFILFLFTHDDSQHILAFWSFLDSVSHQGKMSCHIVWKRDQGFHEWRVNEGRIFHLQRLGGFWDAWWIFPIQAKSSVLMKGEAGDTVSGIHFPSYHHNLLSFASYPECGDRVLFKEL